MKTHLWITMSLALAACRYEALPQLGGGDAQVDDSGGQADARLDAAPIDAPADAAHVCYVPADLGSLTLGTAASPASAVFFTGQDGVDRAFTLAATLPGGTGTVGDLLVITVPKPVGGFVTNQAIPFVTNPNALTGAYTVVYGDYDTSNQMHKQTVFSSNGSITFTAISEVVNSITTATVTLVDYREVDANGANVTPGCTTRLGGLSMTLRLQNQ